MSSTPRQSILTRPLKKQNLNNTENIDLEYQKEQAKLQAKREKYSQLHEYRRKSFWGNQKEKFELQ